MSYLPEMALTHDLPHLSLPASKDYRVESPTPGSIQISLKGSLKIISESLAQCLARISKIYKSMSK
jgi:hypothetical protein